MINFDKLFKIAIEAIPILLMILLIPLVDNDYYLTLAFIVIIAVAFFANYVKKEYIIFIFGFFIMILFEYLFIGSGVETFVRKSLFGVMPIWLPFLWAYGFIAIKRSVRILER